jgi:hypothetical protein
LETGRFSRARTLVEKFLAGLRSGDPKKLFDVLDPAFSLYPDTAAAQRGVPSEIGGAEAWAKRAVEAARGARLARLAMVEGSVGIIVAPRGRLFRVLRFAFANRRIAGMQVIGDPEYLQQIEVGPLDFGRPR